MAGDFDDLDAHLGVAPSSSEPSGSEMAQTDPVRKRPVLLDGQKHALREPEKASALGSIGDAVKNFGAGALNGLNFGLTDEAYGAGAALAGGDYTSARDMVRSDLEDMAQYAPGAQTAGSVAAGVGLNALVPGAAAGGVTGGLARAASAVAPQGIAGMAAQGAVHGYGNSEQEGVGALRDAALGAAGGATAGVATKIPGAVRAVGSAIGRGVDALGGVVSSPVAEGVAEGIGRRGAQALSVGKLGPLAVPVLEPVGDLGARGGRKMLDVVRNAVKSRMAASSAPSEVAEQAAKQVGSSFEERMASDPFQADIQEAIRLRDAESKGMDEMWDRWAGNPDNVATGAARRINGKPPSPTTKAVEALAAGNDKPEVTAAARKVAAKMAEDPAAGAAYHVVQMENNPAYRAAVRQAHEETVRIKYE